MAKQKSDLQVVISGQDKLTAPIAKMVKSVKKLTAPIEKFTRKAKAVGEVTGFNKLGRSIKRTGKSIVRVNTAIGTTTRRLRNLTLVGGAVAAMFFLISNNIADAGLQFERAETKFENAFPDTGLDFLDRLRLMGKELPFTTGQFVGMADTVRGLNSAMEPKKIEEVVTALGDMAALTGADIGQLSLSVAQSLAKGKIETRDIKELASRGIDIRQAMIDTINKTVPKTKIRSVFGKDAVGGPEFEKLMKKGQISSKLFTKAFLGLNKEGGVFFGGMKIFGKTVGGQITRVAGNLEDLKIKFFGTRREAGFLGPVIKSVFMRLEGVLIRVGNFLTVNQSKLAQWAKDFEAILPSVDELVKGIKDLKAQATALWKDLKPLRSLVSSLNKEFGGLKVALSGLTLIIATPLLIALGSLTMSLVGVGGALSKATIFLWPLVKGIAAAAAFAFPSLTLAAFALAEGLMVVAVAMGPFVAIAAAASIAGWAITKALVAISDESKMVAGWIDNLMNVMDAISNNTFGVFDNIINPLKEVLKLTKDAVEWLGKLDFKRTKENGVFGTAGKFWKDTLGFGDTPANIGAEPVNLAAVRPGAMKDGFMIVEVHAAPGTDAVIKDASPQVKADTGTMVGAY